MSTTIVATDQAITKLNDVPFPVPKGTEVVIHKGGMAIISSETNGDGTETEIWGLTKAQFTGMVFRFETKELRDQFRELSKLKNLRIDYESGNSIFRITNGFILSGADDAGVGIKYNNVTTEEFTLVSKLGKVLEL